MQREIGEVITEWVHGVRDELEPGFNSAFGLHTHLI
jgi:hypothetical protein